MATASGKGAYMNQQRILRSNGLEHEQSIRVTWLSQVILFVITAIFIVGPRIPRIPGELGDTISMISILLCFSAPLWIRKSLIPKSLSKYVLCLLFLTAYAGLITVVNGSVDMFSFLRSGRALLNFLAGISLVFLYARILGSTFPRALVSNVYWAISLHGLIMVFQFVFPGFREVVYSFTEPSIHPANLDYRMAGLTTGAGAGTSFMQAIAIIILPVMWTYAKGTRSRIFVIVAFVVNLLAIIVSGRTGLYFSIAFLPVMVFLVRTGLYHRFIWRNNYSMNREPLLPRTGGSVSHRSRGRWLQNIVVLFIVAILIYVSIPLVPGTAHEVFIDRSLSRTLGPFITFWQEGELRDRTARVLVDNHYFLPLDTIVLLFGNSNSGRGELDYIPSDVGYVRLWFALGLVGTVLMIGFYVMLIRDAWRLRKIQADLTLLSVVLSLMVLIAHAKEIFIMARHSFSVSTLFLAGFLYIAAMTSTLYTKNGRILATVKTSRTSRKVITASQVTDK
jgi:hypothetical protein